MPDLVHSHRRPKCSAADPAPPSVQMSARSAAGRSNPGARPSRSCSRPAVSFWLDLDRPAPDDFEILRDAFGFHPLAVEDSEQFDQRAKIDDYDDFVFLVVYGASVDEDELVEVRCFYSERFLV